MSGWWTNILEQFLLDVINYKRSLKIQFNIYRSFRPADRHLQITLPNIWWFLKLPFLRVIWNQNKNFVCCSYYSFSRCVVACIMDLLKENIWFVDILPIPCWKSLVIYYNSLYRNKRIITRMSIFVSRFKTLSILSCGEQRSLYKILFNNAAYEISHFFYYFKFWEDMRRISMKRKRNKYIKISIKDKYIIII